MNHADEILNGSPVTRCFGEQRYKHNPKLTPDKLPIIFLPGTQVFDNWKGGDFMWFGSSGFWESQRWNSYKALQDCNLFRNKMLKQKKTDLFGQSEDPDLNAIEQACVEYDLS